MTAGILLVAFGPDYDRCAAHCVRYSRRFTNLPFYVLTNLTEGQRCPVWATVPGVSFRKFDKSQGENRKAKLRMNEFTPFEKTLYMDCDAVIQKTGVEVFTELLDVSPMVFNWRIEFKPGQKIWNIYARCMKQFGVAKPISIYNGGLLAFRTVPEVSGFFHTWYDMWARFGYGREMPPLNCAIKQTGIDIQRFPLLYFADAAENDHVIIQHNYNGTFNKKFGIPAWSEYKPFDHGHPNDFRFQPIEDA